MAESEDYEIVDDDDQDEEDFDEGAEDYDPVEDDEGEDYPDEDEEYEENRKGKSKAKGPPKQTKVEREREDAEFFLNANKDKTKSPLEEEVDEDEMPNLNTKPSRKVKFRDEEEDEDDEDADLDAKMEALRKYDEDIKELTQALAENQIFARMGDPPYPFLPADFYNELYEMKPRRAARYATMVRNYALIRNSMHAAKTGGIIVEQGLGYTARGVEWAGTKYGWLLEGYSTTLRSRLATEKPMMMRIYKQHVSPLLDDLTGGHGETASDILQLGMLFVGAAEETHNRNTAKQAAQAPRPKGVPVPQTPHERATEIVSEELREKAKDGVHTPAVSSDEEAKKLWAESLKRSISTEKVEKAF